MEVNLDQPTAKLFLKVGKVNEIRKLVKEYKIELVIFNHDLSPSQERNLEMILKARVLDRTGLILDIFATRAKSHVGKLQVELAQLNHLSTRLVRGWSHLERQKGGIGLRGPGETQLETDRRLIGNRIKHIKKKLYKDHKQKTVNRYSRKKSRSKIVSLVGYTNAGKTTLFNLLTGNSKYVANKPFATLDSVTRKNSTKSLRNILFTDTVGFISHLPTQLVESFKGTLDELKSADLLLHVVDISDPDHGFKIKEVENLLRELDLSDKLTILVNNKIDKLDLTELSLPRAKDSPRIWISSKTRDGIDDLLKRIDFLINGQNFKGWISLTPEMGNIRAKLYSSGKVISERTTDAGLIQLEIDIGKKELQQILPEEEHSFYNKENLQEAI
tara:strand:+ start:43775 stop:44935 length:1161 start_codon:yes stop_codon:yes gene_type:complete